MIGGFNGRMPTKKVFRYKIADNTWLKVPKLNCKRAAASSCTIKETVYVFGGGSIF